MTSKMYGQLLLTLTVTLAAAFGSKEVYEKALLYAERYPPGDSLQKELENPSLIEGDIKVAPGQDWPPKKVNPYNAVWDKALLWTDNILYYELESGVFTQPQIDRIEAAIEDIMESTMVDGELCVDIRERTEEDNYVIVGKYGGCYSYVGMIGNSQEMSLDNGCLLSHGTIMHEFLHAFGFFHEHQREDRDDYVTINWDNISPDKWHNFRKYEEGVTIDHLGTHYDYGSVMHYYAYSFAINDTIPTIIPTDPDAEIGQQTHLSECDIERVQLLYGCIQLEDASDCVL